MPPMPARHGGQPESQLRVARHAGATEGVLRGGHQDGDYVPDVLGWEEFGFARSQEPFGICDWGAGERCWAHGDVSEEPPCGDSAGDV